jgi:hypothetical protein
MAPGDELGHLAGHRPARAVGGKANRKWSRCKKGRRSSSTSSKGKGPSGSQRAVTQADQDTQ